MYNLYLRVTDEVCYIGKLLAPSNVFPPEQTVNKENENKQALGVLSWQHTREMKSGEPPRDLMERDKYMFDPILIVPWITHVMFANLKVILRESRSLSKRY